MYRTSPVTGRILPLAAGVVFVAVLLPSTMPGDPNSLPQAILAGLISNLIILMPVLVLTDGLHAFAAEVPARSDPGRG